MVDSEGTIHIGKDVKQSGVKFDKARTNGLKRKLSMDAWSKHTKAGYYRSVSETQSKWRFAGGPIVARKCLLAAGWIFHLCSKHAAI